MTFTPCILSATGITLGHAARYASTNRHVSVSSLERLSPRPVARRRLRRPLTAPAADPTQFTRAHAPGGTRTMPLQSWQNRLPKWLQQQSNRAGASASNILRGSALKAEFPATRAERGLAMRSLVLFGGGTAGHVQTPDWLRQLAAVGFSGGVPTAPPNLSVAQDFKDTLHRSPEAGSVLLAYQPRKKKTASAHCEVRLIEQLRLEPPEVLESLSPLLFYTVLFPCTSCAEALGQVRTAPRSASLLPGPRPPTPPRYPNPNPDFSVSVAQFASERPALRIELTYEDMWRFEDEEIAASTAILRGAGLDVSSIRELASAARAAGGDARFIPSDEQPESRRKPRATSPEEIAEIRAQRAAKRALLEAEKRGSAGDVVR